jgi:hypothetical protein
MRKFERFEYSVITKAPRSLAWTVFSDWTLWPKFSSFYDEIRWTKGDPWQEGSRLTITTAFPIRITLDHVITSCVPAEKVSWIDHAIGITMEQWVFFDSLPDGGTQIRTWGEFTGITAVVAGRRVKDILLEFTRTWYTRYATECDLAADRPVCGGLVRSSFTSL